MYNVERKGIYLNVSSRYSARWFDSCKVPGGWMCMMEMGVSSAAPRIHSLLSWLPESSLTYFCMYLFTYNFELVHIFG